MSGVISRSKGRDRVVGVLIALRRANSAFIEMMSSFLSRWPVR